MGSMQKIQAQLAEAMADHEMDFTYDGTKTGCSCGHWQARGASATADHADHLASMSAPVVKALLDAQLRPFSDMAAEHDSGRGECVCPLCLAVAKFGSAETAEEHCPTHDVKYPADGACPLRESSPLLNHLWKTDGDSGATL